MAIFANYETVKLTTYLPDVSNLLFLLFFVTGILVTRIRSGPSSLLDRPQTDQLRGLAILLIVLGHLWTHVFGGGAHLILAGDAVSLFLLISGYGLGSNSNTPVDTGCYFTRRIRRIMVPYWTVTILLLLLDYILLRRTYGPLNLILTLAGINVSPATQNFDFARWYVTFILFWYLAFFLAVRLFGEQKYLMALFAAAILLFPIHYYFLKFSWYHFFAFPLGAVLGVYKKQVGRFTNRHAVGLKRWAVVAGCIVLLWRILLGTPGLEKIIYARVPNVLLVLCDEGIGLVFSSALIIGMARFSATGYRSRFLLFFGTVSYELYLLHGAFLVKYNPFIGSGALIRLLFSFTLFLVSVTVLAYLLNRGLERLLPTRPPTTGNQVS